MAPRRQRPGLQSGPDDRHLRSTGVLCAVAGTLAMAHDMTQPHQHHHHDTMSSTIYAHLARGPARYGLGCLGDGDARHPGSRLNRLEQASSMSTVAAARCLVGGSPYPPSALIDPVAVQPTTTVMTATHTMCTCMGWHASTGRKYCYEVGVPIATGSDDCAWRRRDVFFYTRRRIHKSHPMETHQNAH